MNSIIIVAGGKGLRMGGDLPKQFIPLHDKPILMHTILTFYNWDSSVEIVVVLPREQESYWQMLCRELQFGVPHKIAYGGEARFYSVKNGLQTVSQEAALISVHDGVRPFVSKAVIDKCFETAEKFGAAIPVVPMIESVREMTNEDSRPFDRSHLCIVQTPQVFRAEILREAYQQPFESCFTDDASVVEKIGQKIHLVEGNRENIKITTPLDLNVAKAILNMD